MTALGIFILGATAQGSGEQISERNLAEILANDCWNISVNLRVILRNPRVSLNFLLRVLFRTTLYMYCVIKTRPGRKSPSGVHGRSPGRGSGKRSPRSWSSLQTLFTNFDCRNDHNLKILHNSPSDPWLVSFTVGAKWHFGGSAPQPLADAATDSTYISVM